jgi:hypothetical protein
MADEDLGREIEDAQDEMQRLQVQMGALARDKEVCLVWPRAALAAGGDVWPRAVLATGPLFAR